MEVYDKSGNSKSPPRASSISQIDLLLHMQAGSYLDAEDVMDAMGRRGSNLVGVEAMETENCGGTPVNEKEQLEHGVLESQKHIPDFEDIIQDIDDVIHNDPVISNSHEAYIELMINLEASSCNLVDIEVVMDNPIILILNSKKVSQLMRPCTTNLRGEFVVGWETISSGKKIQKGQPNKNSTKGKNVQEFKPSPTKHNLHNDSSEKRSPRHRNWKRLMEQDQSHNMCTPLEVVVRQKRKPDMARISKVDGVMLEKKLKSVEVEETIQAVEVARQPYQA